MTTGPLLVPLDFSDRDSGALQLAAAWARATRAAVTLLHVVPAGTTEDGADARACARVQLEVRRELFWPGGPGVGIAVAVGAPGPEIVRAAHELRAGLILLSPRRPRGAPPLRRHGTSARVLRDAPCPVLLARRDAAGDAQPGMENGRIWD